MKDLGRDSDVHEFPSVCFDFHVNLIVDLIINLT